jgi:hypothetical protein
MAFLYQQNSSLHIYSGYIQQKHINHLELNKITVRKIRDR